MVADLNQENADIHTLAWLYEKASFIAGGEHDFYPIGNSAYIVECGLHLTNTLDVLYLQVDYVDCCGVFEGFLVETNNSTDTEDYYYSYFCVPVKWSRYYHSRKPEASSAEQYVVIPVTGNSVFVPLKEIPLSCFSRD